MIAAALVLFTLLGGLIAASVRWLSCADRATATGRGGEKNARENAVKATNAAEAAKKAERSGSRTTHQAEKARDRTRDVLDAMTSSSHRRFAQHAEGDQHEQKKFLTEVLTYYQEFAGEKADDEQTRARTAKRGISRGPNREPAGSQGTRNRGISNGSGRLPEPGRRLPRRARLPAGTGRQPQQPGDSADGIGGAIEAEEQYRQALAIQEKLAADFPAVPDYRQDLARSHNNLGFC